MQSSTTACPHCGAPGGAIGVSCEEPVCQRRGYRFVPTEHLPADASQLDAAIGTMLDDHLLVKALGAGGFGAVYLALQAPLWNPTALKRLHCDPDPATHARRVASLMAEARSLAALTHPNIVRLVKFSAAGDAPYLVMEYVEGARTLASEIRRRAEAGALLGLAEARHIIGQVLDALGAAHARQIVHRDMKPDNVMVQSVHGNPLLVRLVDFGLAKVVAETSQTQMMAGTPLYMAPEQVWRRQIGPWTDLYAVGVMAYELLTGARPFSAPSIEALVLMKVDPDYDPIGPVADRGLPERTVAFLRRALALDPRDRHRTVEAFRADFEEGASALATTGSAALQSVSVAGIVDLARVGATAGSIVATPWSPGQGAPARGKPSATGASWRRRRWWLWGGAAVVVAAVLVAWVGLRRSTERAIDPNGDTASELSLGMDRVARAIDLFRIKAQRLPSALSELVDAGLLAPERFVDPWGQQLALDTRGDTLRLCSNGADTQVGTLDDICYRLRGASLVPDL